MSFSHQVKEFTFQIFCFLHGKSILVYDTYNLAVNYSSLCAFQHTLHHYGLSFRDIFSRCIPPPNEYMQILLSWNSDTENFIGNRPENDACPWGVSCLTSFNSDCFMPLRTSCLGKTSNV